MRLDTMQAVLPSTAVAEMLRHPLRWLLALGFATLVALGGSTAVAQQGQPTPVTKPAEPQPKGQAFPTAEAAFDAFVKIVRSHDRAAMTKLLGVDPRVIAPMGEDDIEELRAQFIAAYDAQHKINMDGDAKAVLEAGKDGWTLPIPVVKTPDGWRFDTDAGADEILARAIGRNELAAIQVVLAIADAQFDYAEMDPMKTGTTQYARRIFSSPGKKDGLYWPQESNGPESPLGDVVAAAQADGANREEGYFGYHYRLLYGQGANAPGGAQDYIVKGRMIGGFGVIAWPVRYGQTGIMTFIVNHEGVVHQKDLGDNTATAAGQIQLYDPDKSWTKADTTP